MGGRSSMVRALTVQASDLGSIPSGFPVLFHIPFSACVCSINILTLIKNLCNESISSVVYILKH